MVGNVYRGEGRVDKQTGGPGQFAVCILELEAREIGAGYEFVDRLAGNAIPRGFLPSIEKGVKAAMAGGILAGYPVVDVRVSVVGGRFHNEDSSDYAFAEAGRLAFRDACRKAPMMIIEPIGMVEVTTPSDYLGAIIGDLAKRRGQLIGQDTLADGTAVVQAKVPVAETFGYMTALRSLTQGRGTYAMSIAGYAEVPGFISQGLIAQSA